MKSEHPVVSVVHFQHRNVRCTTCSRGWSVVRVRYIDNGLWSWLCRECAPSGGAS